MAHISAGTAYTIINRQSGTVVTLNQSTLGGSIPDGSALQQWLLEDAGNGFYYIRSAYSSKPYIDASVNETNPMTCGGKKCAWKITLDPADDTCFNVLTPEGNRCMELANGSIAPNTQIFTVSFGDRANQSWIFNPIPLFKPVTQHFVLRNLATGTVADLNWEAKDVVGAPSGASTNQIWEAEPVNKAINLYCIRNVSQGSYLSLAGKPVDRSPVIVTPTKQIWEIRPDPSAPNPELGQVVRIFYQSTDLMMDLAESSTKPDAPVIMCPLSQSRVNQEWRIKGLLGSNE
ncbi:hypothetical protein DL93DRAFT_2167339 [Clavulina sp. PMI_390]|nr:hypothetical protein DL93DRAFT_2167339 [Clavulina sp. PMI_390]